MKFIPKDMLDLDEKAEKLLDRPLVVYGRKLTNDQRWQMKEKMGKLNKHETMVEGSGDALKYVWETCITRIQNVVMEDEKTKKVTESEELTGKEKNELWDNSYGMETALYGAVAFFQDQSELDEEEVKTSV